MAIAYGNVYVAQIAMGASAQQTLDAFLEAEAYEGPSLIIAYGHCIAHGIDMRFGMRQQSWRSTAATGHSSGIARPAVQPPIRNSSSIRHRRGFLLKLTRITRFDTSHCPSLDLRMLPGCSRRRRMTSSNAGSSTRTWRTAGLRLERADEATQIFAIAGCQS